MTPSRHNPSGTIALCLGAAMLMTACAGTPPPDWQLDAKSALDNALAAHLNGNARVEAYEIERTRREIARTGRVDLLARAELAYCAARIAGLAFEPCAAFEALRADAPPAERAYADYLDAKLRPSDVALLPPAQRSVAQASSDANAATSALQGIEDPLSRLVAAAVLLRSERANPAVITAAVDTSSAQGWRRPLLAWLKVQLALAERAQATAEVERLKRRIALVEGEPAIPAGAR